MQPVNSGTSGTGIYCFTPGFTPAFLPGSSVQLPTFSYFGVDTLVSVPDGGGALLGGVNSAAGGGNQFGPNGSTAGHAQGQQLQVRAQILDMAELDAQVLAAAGPPKSAAPPDSRALALRAAQNSSAGRGTVSVTEARRLYEAQSEGQNVEARKWFERGQQAESDGKPGTAKIYYQMAARRSTGELHATIAARLQVLAAAHAATAVAQGDSR